MVEHISMNHSSFGRFLGVSGWISSCWLTDKLTELAGDKSDGAVPENAPNECSRERGGRGKAP